MEVHKKSNKNKNIIYNEPIKLFDEKYKEALKIVEDKEEEVINRKKSLNTE